MPADIFNLIASTLVINRWNRNGLEDLINLSLVCRRFRNLTVNSPQFINLREMVHAQERADAQARRAAERQQDAEREMDRLYSVGRRGRY